MKASATAAAAGCLRRQKNLKEIKFYGEFFCPGDWFLSPSPAPTLRGENIRKRERKTDRQKGEREKGERESVFKAVVLHENAGDECVI